MKLIDVAYNRSRTFFLLLALMIISGIYTYGAIPKESNPDISIPIIYVSVNHDGISPEDAVNLLVKPLEQELRTLEGVDEMKASAYEGGANVTLTYDAGFDSDKALEEVRNQVDIAKAELPEDADEPTVHEVNFSKFPVIDIVIRSTLPEREIRQLSEDLQDRIEGIGAVLEVTLNGLREQQLLIEVNQDLLQSYNIPPARFFEIVRNANLLVAAGSLEVDSGKYAVKLPGLLKTTDDLLNLPILVEGEKTVRVKDIADVRLGFKDSTTVTRVNGKKTVIINVSKRSGENAIKTVNAIKAAVEEESLSWPEGVSFSYMGDESIKIYTMLYDLQNNVIFAIILVMIIILAALGTKSAMLVSTAIPGSFLIALTILYSLDLSLNMVVLFAMILSVGMLVDGAIVVTEMSDRKMREGLTSHEAFAFSAKYMSWPIIASTATTLAAFMPLLFWPDVVGEFMKFLPMTLIFTLLGSLVMALIFIPLLGSRLRKNTGVFEDDIFVNIAVKYRALLIRALKHPKKIMLMIIGAFIGANILYGALGKGVEFFPNVEAERANILIRAKGDLSLHEKDTLMKTIGERLFNIEGIETMYLLTKGAGKGGNNRNVKDVIGTVAIEVKEWADRERTSNKIFDEVLERIGPIPGVIVELEKEKRGPGKGKPIQIAISSDDQTTLAAVISEIKQRLDAFDGVMNVTDSLADPGIEWQIIFDRLEAAKAGTTLAEAGTLVRLATTGAILGTYRPDHSNDEIDIVVRFAKDERHLSTIDNMTIATNNGQIPLSQFATRTAQKKVTSIERLDQKNVGYIEADVNLEAGYLSNDIVKGLRAEIAKAELPRGVAVSFKGEDEQQAEAGAFLMKAFTIAIFVMAAILVTQFNSFYQAFIILTAVILSTTGVLLGHLVTRDPFGIVMSGLGVIALAGIVVNNNIVLIDTFNKLKAEMQWYDALVETCTRRLRPVLLTAITTIIGLIPMGTKINVDLIARQVSYNTPSSQWWDQLANSIMFGLGFATILTLIVTPCMLAIGARRSEKRAAKNREK